MTRKTDFTEEEWELLVAAPGIAGLAVVASDSHIAGTGAEVEALVRSTDRLEVPEEAEDLVLAVRAEIREEDAAAAADIEYAGDTGEEADAEAELLDDPVGRAVVQLEKVASILDQNAEPAEADAFKQWVLRIADAVANASPEGYMGIGPPQVSGNEAAALSRIAEALGTDAPEDAW
jgi:hypothetical protein